MSKKAKQNPNQKSNLKKYYLLIIFGMLSCSVILLSYFSMLPSFIDQKYTRSIDNFYASIPLIPKTSRQVITKAFIKNQSLLNYSILFKTKLENKNDEKLLELELTGAVDQAGFVGSKSKANIKGILVEPIVGEIDLETFEDDSYFYFKSNKALPLTDLDLSKVNNSWYKIDRDKFEQSIGFSTRSDSEIIDDIRNQFSSIYKELEKESLFSKITERKEEKIGQEDFYRIKFQLQGRSITNPLFQDNFKPDGYELTIWVNKKTFYLNRANLVSKARDPNLNEEIEGHFDYTISKIHSDSEITPPSVSEEIPTALDLTLLLKGALQQPSSEEFLDASVAANEVGQNFLILERFLKVILLLPKSL